MGKRVIENLKSFGFRGSICAAGKNGGMIEGYPLFPNVMDISIRVDVALVLVGAGRVPDTLEKCGRKGIQRVVVCSAGFSEFGSKGKTLDHRISDIAEKYDLRIVGPNCMGLINMNHDMCLHFGEDHPSLWKKGPVGIMAQSGTVALHYARHISREGIGVSKVVSMGNKLNLDEVDYLRYYLKDKDTRIIFAYLESFSRGREFLELARSATKPILVQKANTSALSRSIALSHTHALAGDDRVVASSLRQAGVVRIRSLEDFLNCVKVLLLPPLKGNRLSVLSHGGGIGVMAADECHRNHFELPSLPQSFIAFVQKKGSADVITLTNPVDLGVVYDFGVYPDIMEKLLEMPGIDGIVYDGGFTPPPGDFEIFGALYRNLSRLQKRSSKPVFIRIPFYDAPGIKDLTANLSIPFFQSSPGMFEAMRKVKDSRIGSGMSSK